MRGEEKETYQKFRYYILTEPSTIHFTYRIHRTIICLLAVIYPAFRPGGRASTVDRCSPEPYCA